MSERCALVQVSSLRTAVKKSDVGELRDGMAELKSRVKSLDEKVKVAGERRETKDISQFLGVRAGGFLEVFEQVQLSTGRGLMLFPYNFRVGGRGQN